MISLPNDLLSIEFVTSLRLSFWNLWSPITCWDAHIDPSPSWLIYIWRFLRVVGFASSSRWEKYKVYLFCNNFCLYPIFFNYKKKAPSPTTIGTVLNQVSTVLYVHPEYNIQDLLKVIQELSINNDDVHNLQAKESGILHMTVFMVNVSDLLISSKLPILKLVHDMITRPYHRLTRRRVVRDLQSLAAATRLYRGRQWSEWGAATSVACHSLICLSWRCCFQKRTARRMPHQASQSCSNHIVPKFCALIQFNSSTKPLRINFTTMIKLSPQCKNNSTPPWNDHLERQL